MQDRWLLAQGFKLCIVTTMTGCLLGTGVCLDIGGYTRLDCPAARHLKQGDTLSVLMVSLIRFVCKCVNYIWAHSGHSIKKSWAAEFSALNCCSSRYYTLATMTARMPLKGGGQSTFADKTCTWTYIPLRETHLQPYPCTQGKKPTRKLNFHFSK